jgi:ribosomal protein L37AE/L43A
MSEAKCDRCGTPLNPHRYDIGYTTCLPCGEKIARQVKHCIVPMAKSNYIVVTDRSLLKQLNKYGRG